MTDAVFFDLDGTFADTAPDLGFAVNRMRERRGLAWLPLAATRPVTSLGARGLLMAGFGIGPEHPEYGAMREEFLAIYEQNIARETRLFPGMPELIARIEARDVPWGIVTNKAERLARALLDRLEMSARSRCVIGGDSTPHLKPHPRPLLAACEAVGVAARSCIYVGDDQRDVAAARAAGMRAAVAGWGYLNGGRPASWQPDWLLGHPLELERHL